MHGLDQKVHDHSLYPGPQNQTSSVEGTILKVLVEGPSLLRHGAIMHYLRIKQSALMAYQASHNQLVQPLNRTLHQILL